MTQRLGESRPPVDNSKSTYKATKARRRQERQVFSFHLFRRIIRLFPVDIMENKIFYSWQSDLSSASNRGFILTALERAAAAIKGDDTIAVEPVVDRDTKGIAGTPHIVASIFEKIDAADIFIADVSIINSGQPGRPTPNPNVLVELGYAINSIGWGRILLLYNLAFGAETDLPFDLDKRRLILYTMSADAQDRAPERKKLQQKFNDALRAIFSGESKNKAHIPIRIELEQDNIKVDATSRITADGLADQIFFDIPMQFKNLSAEEIIFRKIKPTISLPDGYSLAAPYSLPKNELAIGPKKVLPQGYHMNTAIVRGAGALNSGNHIWLENKNKILSSFELGSVKIIFRITGECVSLNGTIPIDESFDITEQVIPHIYQDPKNRYLRPH
jgi:hypothetical protein